MVEGGSGTGFATETFERLRVMSHVLRHELERDEATKLGVLSLIDDTHPAPAELLDDAVVRDGLSDHGAQAEMVGMRGRGSQRIRGSSRENSQKVSVALFSWAYERMVKKAFAAGAASQ